MAHGRRRIIVVTDRTGSAIAYAAGFADLSHFNRSFRQRYRCTPSNVRARQRRPGDDDPAC